MGSAAEQTQTLEAHDLTAPVRGRRRMVTLLRDLVRMHVELLSQFDQCPLALMAASATFALNAVNAVLSRRVV